jgi:hypothetical protein
MATMPLQFMLMLAGPIAQGLGAAAEKTGKDSDRLNKYRFTRNVIARPLEFVGRNMQKPAKFMEQDMGTLAEKGRFSNLLDGFSKQQGKVMELVGDKLGVAGRMKERVARKATKLAERRTQAAALGGGVTYALKDIDEASKLAPGLWAQWKKQFLAQDVTKDKFDRKQRAAIEKYLHAVEDQKVREHKASIWEDPVNAIIDRNRNRSVEEVAVKIARGAVYARRIYGDIADTSSYIKSLKLLAADATGKDISYFKGMGGTWRVLFGKDMPPVVKQARKTGRVNILPRWGATIGSIALVKPAQKFASRIGVGGTGLGRELMGMMAYEGINNIVDNGAALLAKDYDTAHIYANLRVHEDMAKAGEAPPLDAPAYLDLIVSTSKKVRKEGGLDNQYAQLCAAYYAEHQTPLAEVLKDLNRGDKQIEKRAHEAHQYFLVEQANRERAAAASQAVSRPADIAAPGAGLDRQAEADYWRSQQSKAGAAGLNSQAEANYWSGQQNKSSQNPQGYRDFVDKQRQLASRTAAGIGAG